MLHELLGPIIIVSKMMFRDRDCTKDGDCQCGWGKILFFENELRSFEHFRSGREIFRLGALIKKWQLALTACVLLYEKQSFLYELLERAVNRQPGLPPGELVEQTQIRQRHFNIFYQ